MSPEKQVAVNLRYYRYVKRLSQGDVADRMTAAGHPFTNQLVSKIEHRQRRVKVEDLVSLARALDVSVDALLSPAAFDGGVLA